MSADLPPPCVSFGPVQSLIYLRAGDYFTADQMRAYATKAVAAQAAELEALRADAALLQWILSHPETCAEELEDACASLLDPRTCLERRKAGIEAAARAALKEQEPNARGNTLARQGESR